MKINNRRYIGSKTKLLEEIEKILISFPAEDYPRFFDAFGGTGVVTELANSLGYTTTINDMLYSNFVSYSTWFSSEEINIEKMNNIISKFNSYDNHISPNNYFNNIYGGKYFSEEIASKINYIREEIELLKSELSSREYNYLLTSLMYATDKSANTVGHFEHYLTHGHEKKDLKLQELELKNIHSTIFCQDTNQLAVNGIIDTDILYLDPPYNARQYINFYHVLENLMRWEKPMEFEGKSMKFKRDHLKSEYSRKNAILHFKELVENSQFQILILSYNNTYNAKSGASNNKMQEEDILNVLESAGNVSIVDVNYKAFQTGKTDLKNHVEKFFICDKR